MHQQENPCFHAQRPPQSSRPPLPALATRASAEYKIQILGLNDPAHTLAPGNYSSTVTANNAEGDIDGTSKGTAGNNSEVDAWLYNAATRTISQISPPTSIFSADSSAYSTSTLYGLNVSGDAIGTTSFYGSATNQAAWFAQQFERHHRSDWPDRRCAHQSHPRFSE